MKGVAIILAFGWLVIAFFIVVPLLVFSFLPGRVEYAVLTRDIYLMENTLDYQAIATETAFSYSFYQGCFDVLRKGGYSSIPPQKGYESEGGILALWWDTGDQSPSPDDFLREVGKETAKDLNTYTSTGYDYVGDFSIALPRDYQLTLERLPDFEVKALALSPAFIEVKKEDEKRGETVTLRKDSILQKNFSTSCLEIFEKEKSLSAAIGSGMQQAASAQAARWIQSGQAEKEGPPDFTPGQENEEMGNLVFQTAHQKTLAQAEEETAAALRAVLPSLLPPEDPPFRRTADILDLSVDIAPLCSAIQETRTVNNQDRVFTKISCTFTTSILMVTRVASEDTREDKKLPVFNGQDVAFSPLRLLTAQRVDATTAPGTA